jgi:hypothetical protein
LGAARGDIQVAMPGIVSAALSAPGLKADLEDRGSSARITPALQQLFSDVPDDAQRWRTPTSVTAERLLELPSEVSPEELQIVGGSPPLDQREDEWRWTGFGDATLLITDRAKAQNDERLLFYAGLILGIAGAAAMTALVEFAGALFTRDA